MKVRIEMEVPDDMDPSTVLERMQEVALEFAEQYGELPDDDEEDVPADAFLFGSGVYTREEIENEVSVQTGN